jgi:hypothetical protein
MKPDRALLGAWLLGIIVSVLAVLAWGLDYGFSAPFNTYQFFPLLGLLAFSLMWSHYIIGTIGELFKVTGDKLKPYFRWTGYVVLVLLCLHPGLLVYQRFRDGAGLPPGSYESYVSPNLAWITLLGTASLLVFLAFELHRIYGKKPWFRYVQDASDPAMLAIAYHGLKLGSNLQLGWFQTVWWFYALTLLMVLIRKYYLRYAKWRAKT